MAPPEALDDGTMNQLLKNLIAKLLQKDFPGYGEGDKLAMASWQKNARRRNNRKRAAPRRPSRGSSASSTT